MDPVPVPTESALPTDRSGGLRYFTHRSKEGAPATPSGKDERLWSFEPIGFIYDDTDTFFSEISEWFCFDETEDLKKMEEVFYEKQNFSEKLWYPLSDQKKSNHIQYLLDQLDLASDSRRMDVYRCLCYIALGVFGECKSKEEVRTAMFANSKLLFRNGALGSMVESLHRESAHCPEHVEVVSNALSSPAVANLTIQPVDTLPLRLVMTPLYVMMESIRTFDDGAVASDLRDELNDSFPRVDELLAVTLFDMLTRFCNGDAPHYPIRKISLLLWKTLLTSLGGLKKAHDVKNNQREAYDLPVVEEFTSDVCANMRPCSPPPADGPTFINQIGNSGGAENTVGDANESKDGPKPNSKPARSSRPAHFWRPKVGHSELEKFINDRRMKFVSFTAPGDIDSMIGLPKPIHEAVRVLKQHVYRSHAEAQLKEEEQIARLPVTFHGVKTDIDEFPAERLFAAMLPSLPQYCIAVLKLMLAAEPPPPSNAANAAAGGAPRPASGSLSVLTDCVQLSLTGQSSASVTASLQSGIEVCRHRETVLKALSAILLLLLKHFKACHILHFELISQHLVFANALPLLVRLLSHNVCGLAAASNSVPLAQYPGNVLLEEDRVVRGGSTLTEEDRQQLVSDIGSESQFNWRVVHTVINLLRILNKLVKGKSHRVALLHSLKCSGLLKRIIRLKQALLQLYALKLLKLQSRFLGRQWRRQNMHSVSAIYERVRHRLTDDWAYGAVDSGFAMGVREGLDPAKAANGAPSFGPACPEFQAAESQLRCLIDRYHSRKYHSFQLETACVIDGTSYASKCDGISPLLMPTNVSDKNQPLQSQQPDSRHCCTEMMKCHCTVWSATASTSILPDLAAVCTDFFAGTLVSQMTPEEWVQRELENPIDWNVVLQEQTV